ncbi:MAG: hypothetical protein JWP74_3528 [Marmoricola sp.]|nr:hypothetical protein [Marmoricola sp.]
MTSDADLTAVLGAAPPAAIGALPAETLARLTEQISAAKEHVHGEMDASVQKAIAGVPFAVRGIVRKALLG